jgi:hypothetical protein
MEGLNRALIQALEVEWLTAYVERVVANAVCTAYVDECRMYCIRSVSSSECRA